jgi:hypothetical protein
MNKEEQKKIIIEVMDADAKDGLYEKEDKTFKQKSKWTKVNNKQQTAVEWLVDNLPQRFKNAMLISSSEIIEEAKAMEQLEIYTAYETGWVNGDLKKAPRYGKDYYNKIHKLIKP